MQPTITSGDPRADLKADASDADATGRHGDVDKNGDLVDELDSVLRLRAAISAATPAEEEDQLRAVVRMLRRAGVEEVRP